MATIFEFLLSGQPLPKMVTVAKSQNGKYQFYLLVRQYREKLNLRPQFIEYRKQDAVQIKGEMEEHSVFTSKNLYVLEAFPSSFVEKLVLPEGTYCVAEVEAGGELTSVPFNPKLRGELLKVLRMQLNLPYKTATLKQIDWSDCREYGEMEVQLNRLKVMGTPEAEVEERAKEEKVEGSILTLLKRGRHVEVLKMVEKYGPNWVYNHLIEQINTLAHYKALIMLGYDDVRAARELEMSWMRAKQMEDAARTVSKEDLIRLARRVVDMDQKLGGKNELALEILLLNSGISIVRN